MKTFKGRAGESVRISGSVGDHVLSGFIAVKEKGVKNGNHGNLITLLVPLTLLFQLLILQVLYLNWNNRIRVSASGYKPEAIRLLEKDVL